MIVSDNPEYVLADWDNSIFSLPSMPGKGITVESFLVVAQDGKKDAVLNELRELFSSDSYIKVNDLETEIIILEEQMQQRVAILYAITAVVWVIGLLGGMTIISANLLVKRREYGILRAIYVTPKQLIAMVLTQCVLFGLISFLIGTSIGLFLSKIFTTAIGTQFTINWINLLIMILGSACVFCLTLIQPWLFARKIGQESVTRVLGAE